MEQNLDGAYSGIFKTCKLKKPKVSSFPITKSSLDINQIQSRSGSYVVKTIFRVLSIMLGLSFQCHIFMGLVKRISRCKWLRAQCTERERLQTNRHKCEQTLHHEKVH